MKTSLKTTVITISIIVVILIALIITLYFVGRKQGKKAATEGNKGKLPQETDWGNTLTDVEGAEIKRIAEALYADMKGVNMFTRNSSIYYEYNRSSDRVFVGVANYFADQYGESLAKWMDDESYSWLSFELQGVVDSILARLATHGIKA